MSLAPLLRLGVSYVFREAQTRLKTRGRICAQRFGERNTDRCESGRQTACRRLI